MVPDQTPSPDRPTVVRILSFVGPKDANRMPMSNLPYCCQSKAVTSPDASTNMRTVDYRAEL